MIASSKNIRIRLFFEIFHIVHITCFHFDSSYPNLLLHINTFRCYLLYNKLAISSSYANVI